jgi:hypothetical protein
MHGKMPNTSGFLEYLTFRKKNMDKAQSGRNMAFDLVALSRYVAQFFAISIRRTAKLFAPTSATYLSTRSSNRKYGLRGISRLVRPA